MQSHNGFHIIRGGKDAQPHQQQAAAIKRHLDNQILYRWDFLHQSAEKISKSMRIGTLRVQQALRDREAKAPPAVSAALKKAA